MFLYFPVLDHTQTKVLIEQNISHCREIVEHRLKKYYILEIQSDEQDAD